MKEGRKSSRLTHYLRMKTFAVLLLVSLALPACRPHPGTNEEVKADFELLCNAIERSGANPGPNQEREATAYAKAHLATKEAADALAALGFLKGPERGPALKAAAVKAGYDGPCPTADQR
jgi:hypothetical protein